MACTRNLLRELNGNEGAILQWLGSRKQELIDAMQSEVGFDSLKAEVPFSKLMATLKVSPTARAQIRKIVEPHTPSLIEALNDFIQEAMAKTPQEKTDKLVLIVDSLDRIPPILREKEPSNHEQIFIDRSEQLKMLKCHVIYTVPISLVYSGRGTDLRDIYDAEIQVLPMVMLRDEAGNICDSGLEVMRSLVHARVRYQTGVLQTQKLVGDIFDTQETLDQLCLMSGGHMRNLMQMAQEAIKQSSTLPITKKAVRLGITKARNIYRNTVYDPQWSLLAKVSQTKEILNDEAHRELLFNRCILEYRYLNQEGNITCWRDVHPLLFGVKEFRSALERIESQPNKHQEDTIYRFSLPKSASELEKKKYFEHLELLKKSNPKWTFIEDRLKEDENYAILIMNGEKDYVNQYGAYIINRSIGEIIEKIY